MQRYPSLIAYIIAAILDLAVLAAPGPIQVKAALAPLLAGIAAGMVAPSPGKASLAAIIAGLTTLLIAFLVNYLRAPIETINAVNTPGFYSMLPVIIQTVVPLLAAAGTSLITKHRPLESR